MSDLVGNHVGFPTRRLTSTRPESKLSGEQLNCNEIMYIFYNALISAIHLNVNDSGQPYAVISLQPEQFKYQKTPIHLLLVSAQIYLIDSRFSSNYWNRTCHYSLIDLSLSRSAAKDILSK